MPATALATPQAYNILDPAARPGMVVSLTKNSGVIEPSTDKNSSLVLGVLTTNAALDQQPGQVSVETDGVSDTIVSTLNGDIKVGDRIMPSSIAGAGAKASSSAWVVGIAQASLDPKSVGAVASTIQDSAGKKHQVYVGHIPMVVHVVYVGSAGSQAKSQLLPNSLQSTADSLAGKRATTLGLVLSFSLLIIGVYVGGQIITSAVRNSFSAIARQPLAKKVVYRLMFRSFAIAIALIISLLVGSLLLLRVL